jgi:signal transduction histidine kinase
VKLALITLLLFCSLVSLGVGLLVAARDYRKRENLAFLGIAIGITLWAVGIAGFLGTDSLAAALWWAKLYYIAPLLLVACSVVFAASFLYRLRLNRFIQYAVPAFGAIFVGLLAAWPTFMTSEVVRRSYGKQVLLDKWPYLAYGAYLLFCFAVTLYLTYAKMRGSKQLLARSQARVFLMGYSISCALGVFFNLILPAFGNYRLIAVGPICTSVFLFATGYAIVRHRLFDIRAVVARSLGYGSSLVVLAALYGFIVFGVAQVLFDTRLPISLQIFFAGATVLVAIASQPMKRAFDKATNKLFYRDAYDAQELYGQLNKMLVGSLDVKYLMMQSISIIESALKSDFAVVGLREGPDSQRIFASRKMNFRQEDINKLRSITPSIHHKVIVTDYIEGSRHSELKALLQANGIAVVVRLAQNIRSSEEGLGYLVLGPKKSGNPYTPQDARVLDTVANELIIAIQNALHYEEIQRFNEALQSRVDEATRKLRRTNDKLKELDETKDDFISMASHQLRTPLTSVKGYLSMVLEGDAGSINETQKKMLGQAFVSSQRMVYLIADLLNVSRLRTGKFMIEPIRTDLSVMIGEELAQLVETAAARDIQLTYDKPKDYPLLMLDETKTRQVIMNFVDNAIYYTPAGGHIRVELTTTDHAAELRVVDDGIGVPKAEQHHLFTKFYRAGNARKARPDGTGLGLFMAKKVILAQGGVIIFDSHEGKGSTFGFSFPLSKLRATESTQPAQPIIAKIPVAK